MGGEKGGWGSGKRAKRECSIVSIYGCLIIEYIPVSHLYITIVHVYYNNVTSWIL